MDTRIDNEARRLFGIGKQASAFIQGAIYSQRIYPSLNHLSRLSYANAIKRGKTREDYLHLDTLWGIFDEIKEFRQASESKPSEHLPNYTEAEEELADILICCLTELRRRGVNIDKLISDKIQFNETR